MAAFAALMALSASNTRESESVVQAALVQRQRKEEQLKQQREAREKKERELAAQQRQRHFEEAKKKAEEEERKAKEEEARQKERERRQEEQKLALLYGPKRASTSKAPPDYPTSKSKPRDQVKKQRNSDDDDDPNDSMALTREEKRERKLKAQRAREFGLNEKRTGSGSHAAKRSKSTGRRLPGGAIDMQTSASPSTSSADPHMSVKARLKAQPNTLTKLNVNKRDMRTIDEIMQDRAKAKELKTLEGDEAKNFNGWFDQKKPEPSVKVSKSSAAPSKTSSMSNTPLQSGIVRNALCERS